MLVLQDLRAIFLRLACSSTCFERATAAADGFYAPRLYVLSRQLQKVWPSIICEEGTIDASVYFFCANTGRAMRDVTITPRLRYSRKIRTGTHASNGIEYLIEGAIQVRSFGAVLPPALSHPPKHRRPRPLQTFCCASPGEGPNSTLCISPAHAPPTNPIYYYYLCRMCSLLRRQCSFLEGGQYL